MEEGMSESTIQVAGPSYPAEFGNEAYRIAESMEAGAAADHLGSYGHDTASDAYNSTNTMQQQALPPQYAAR